MAVITRNETDGRKAVRFLESRTITNLTPSENNRRRAVKVPEFAKYASFYLFITSQGGTSPTLDMGIEVPDFSTAEKLHAPTDDNLANLADFAGITQVTGAGPYLQTIDIGPGVTGIADDATGAAAADARMAINTVLPPWLVYRTSLDGTTGDEDYTFQLVLQFRA